MGVGDTPRSSSQRSWRSSVQPRVRAPASASVGQIFCVPTTRMTRRGVGVGSYLAAGTAGDEDFTGLGDGLHAADEVVGGGLAAEVPLRRRVRLGHHPAVQV